MKTCYIGNKPLTFPLDPRTETAVPSDAKFATSAIRSSNLKFASLGEMLGLPWNGYAYNYEI